MYERIKELRKHLNLTQQRFADAIGLKRNSVAQIELGDRSPSNSVINNICKTFDVNEVWLRTGEGEMFLPRSRHDEIAEFMRDLTYLEDGDFKVRLISVLSRLDEDGWKLLESMAQQLRAEESQ